MNKAPYRFHLGLATALICALASAASAQEPKPVPMPEPTVPEVFTLEGQFVRIAYNNEGFVTLGYRTANYSLGQEWMLLDVGMTLRHGAKAQVVKRDAVSVKTPDGAVVPLATQKEYMSVDLRGIQMMAEATRDSISYFPPGVVRPCVLAFFADPESRTVSFDQVELNDQTGCVGRLYFRIPGGIKVGQHWLIVRFSGGVVEVPFRILTKEEEKELRKRWPEIKKEHEAGL